MVLEYMHESNKFFTNVLLIKFVTQCSISCFQLRYHTVHRTIEIK